MSTNEAASPSPPAFGQRLRQARESLNLTLAGISDQTRIPVSRLQDLENDVYANFGGLAYARSFLRTYATLLGLDAADVLPQAGTQASSAQPQPNEPAYLVPSLSSWVVSTSRTKLQLGPSPSNSRRTRRRAWVLVTGAILLLGTVAALGKAWYSRHAAGTAVPVVPPAASPSPEVEVRKAVPARNDAPPAPPVEGASAAGS